MFLAAVMFILLGLELVVFCKPMKLRGNKDILVSFV